jgi:hypothetical protein
MHASLTVVVAQERFARDFDPIGIISAILNLSAGDASRANLRMPSVEEAEGSFLRVPPSNSNSGARFPSQKVHPGAHGRNRK